MKTAVCLAIVFLLLVSCTPQKRLQRLLKRHPYLVTTREEIDTIFKDATRVDTMFHFKTDSIILEKEKLIVKYRKEQDTIYLSGECLEDTLIVKNTRAVLGHPINKPNIWPYVALGIILLMLVFRLR